MRICLGSALVVSIHAFREGRRHFDLPSSDFPTVFQSTPSAREGDDIARAGIEIFYVFQSTPSAREGDATSRAVRAVFGVSIHAFREGRRRYRPVRPLVAARFNPRLPRGKATSLGAGKLLQSMVSIHAFREGRRRASFRAGEYFFDVSIHAFREGRRLAVYWDVWQFSGFQSTPSAREGDYPRTGAKI